MPIIDAYMRQLDQIHDLPDLIAATYSALMACRSAQDQTAFLIEVETPLQEKKLQDALEAFTQSLRLDFQRMLTSKDQQYLSIFDLADRLKSALKKISNLKNDTQPLPISRLLYQILIVCDHYWQQSNYHDSRSKNGPLNRNIDHTKCLVYAKEPPDAWRNQLYSPRPMLRRIPEEPSIARRMSQFFIIDDSEVLSRQRKAYPVIYRWKGAKGILNHIDTLRIACVPMFDEMQKRRVRPVHKLYSVAGNDNQPAIKRNNERRHRNAIALAVAG